MAWQPHDSNNADRAVSPYEDRNVSNDVIGNTNTENAYVRNDEANAAEDPQLGITQSLMTSAISTQELEC